MKPTKLLTTSLALLFAAGALQAQSFQGRDVGNPTLVGSHTGSAPGMMTVTGGGADIWGTSDQFYYYYASISGQVWDAKIRVHDLVRAAGDDGWTKCQLMVRVPDASGIPQGPDPFIGAMTTASTGQNEVAPQYRATRGGDAGNDKFGFPGTVNPTYPNTWLRITRVGSVFTMWFGTDGTTWTKYCDIDTAQTRNGFGNAFPDPVLVGVAVTAHNNSDPIGGIATVSDLSINVTPSTPVLTAVTQVQNATTTVGSDAYFRFTATNTAIANGAVGNYQWYKNDVLVPNVAGQNYALFASAADNGAQVYCRAWIPGGEVYSATGTVTVLAPTEYPGFAKYEVFPGQSLANVANGNHGRPSQVQARNMFEAPANWSDNFGSRLSGYFVPPANGNYTFYICSDDDSNLYLSTDSSPANARIICQQEGWANPRMWQTHGGGGTANAWSQRRSDMWFDPVSQTIPYALGIPLVGGQKYFIMAVHREGGGGDNLAAYYTYAVDFVPQIPDPVDGDAPNLTGDRIIMLSRPTTTLTVTDPVDYTAWEGQTALFSVTATTDSEISPLYQWQRNEVNMAGRTAATLNLTPASLLDNDASYRCIVSLPHAGLSVTSAPATLTVNASVFVTGVVKYDVWGPGSPTTRAQVNAGTAGEPWSTTYRSSFEGPTDWANDYASRLSAWFIPPANGNYVFLLSSDDDSDLFLSTNDDPATKRIIAQQAGWNGAREWNGGQNLTQRSSETWTPDGGVTVPFADGIALVGGQQYYIEATHREGGGGDNLEVYFILKGGTAPANGTFSNIRDARVGMKFPQPTSLTITEHPQSVAVDLWDPAVFTVAATTDALYPPQYQWRRGGLPIAGATSTQYRIASATPADNGALIDCVVSLQHFSPPRTSSVAVLTVRPDTVPPQMRGAGAIAKSDGTTIELGVEFNERMDHTSVTNLANYSLSKGVVTRVRHYPWVGMPTFDAVALEVTGIVHGDTVNVTVQNAKDYSLNTLPTTTKPATVNTAIRYAVVGGRELYTTPPAGTTQADWPDEAVALGGGNYLLISSCNSHWGQYDEQTYVYEVLTGNFERVVRVQYQDDSSNWARTGIMAREQLQEGMTRDEMSWQASRLANIRANPRFQWTGANANNQIERNARKAVAGGYEDMTGGAGGNPAYPNQWLRIARTGNTLQVWHSANDGQTWINGGTWTPDEWDPLAAQMYVGPYYAPELNNNNSAAGIGHSTKAIVRSFGASIPAPVVITVTLLEDGNVQLNWTPGTELESSMDAEGPYLGTGNTSGSLMVDPTEAHRFWRARRN